VTENVDGKFFNSEYVTQPGNDFAQGYVRSKESLSPKLWCGVFLRPLVAPLLRAVGIILLADTGAGRTLMKWCCQLPQLMRLLLSSRLSWLDESDECSSITDPFDPVARAPPMYRITSCTSKQGNDADNVGQKAYRRHLYWLILRHLMPSSSASVYEGTHTVPQKNCAVDHCELQLVPL